MSILEINKSYKAVNVSFSEDKMMVDFEDGRMLSIPIEWFPKLRDASKTLLENWRFIGEGEGIHWSELDEDILIENLIS